MSDNNKIETTLWKTADKLRNKMYAAEYKNIDFKDAVDDGEAFEEKMKKLTFELNEQFEKSNELQIKIKENLSKIKINI